MSGTGQNNFQAPDRLTPPSGDETVGNDVEDRPVRMAMWLFQFLQRILSYLGQPVAGNKPGVTISQQVSELNNEMALALSGVGSAVPGIEGRVALLEAMMRRIAYEQPPMAQPDDDWQILPPLSLPTHAFIMPGAPASRDVFAVPRPPIAWNAGTVEVIGAGLTLSADRTLAAVGGGGTGSVTEILTSGSGIAASPATITGTGTLSVEWNAGTVAAIGSGLSIAAGNTLIATGGSGSATTIIAGTGLTGGTITTSGTIALDPLGNSIVINSGTIDTDFTPNYFSSAFTLGTTDRGKFYVDNGSGTADVIVTLPTFTAGTKLWTDIQNNSTAHITRLRPATGVTIDGIPTADGLLATYTSTRLSLDSTGTNYVAQATNDWWQPGNYVSALGAGIQITNNGTFNTNGTLGLNLIAGTNISITGTTAVTISATGAAAPVQRLTSQLTPTGNGNDTTEDTLQTYTLPANTLLTNGQAIRIVASGTFAANTHTKTVRAYLGSTQVNLLQIASSSNSVWDLEVIIWRTTASNAEYRQAKNFTETGVSAVQLSIGNATLAEDLTTNLVIKITGQITGTTAANDIVCNAMMVEFLP